MPPKKKARKAAWSLSHESDEDVVESVQSDDDVKCKLSVLQLCQSQEPTLEESEVQKKKAKPLILTAEQEDDIVKWLKGNPCLFNKKLNDYRNTELKSLLWNLKGEELQVEAALLKTWFESMRTRFGKLTKTQSFDDAAENTDLTERDQWIIDRFEFLHQHIVRIRRRHGGGLTNKLASKVASAATAYPHQDVTDDDDDEEEEEDPEPRYSSTTPVPHTSTPPPSTSKSSSSKGPAVKSSQNVIMEKRAEESEKLQDRVEDTKEGKSAKHIWGQWLASMVPQIDDSLITDFYQQSFDSVMWYVNRSQQIRSQQQQCQPQRPDRPDGCFVIQPFTE